MKALLAAALALAMSFPAQACEFTLPDTVAAMTAEGVNFVVLDESQRADFLARLTAVAEQMGLEHDLTTVTDVLLFRADDGGLAFGLVREDGCLTPPVPITALLPPTQGTSGATPDGKVGA